MQPLLIQLAVGAPECEMPNAYRTIEQDFIGACAGEGSGSLPNTQLLQVTNTVISMLFDLFEHSTPERIHAAIDNAARLYMTEH